MNTYLFGWNPVKHAWHELPEAIEKLKEGIHFTESWTCASHKKVKKGDRAFFMHLGKEPRGLFASGYVSSEPYAGKNRKGRDCFRVDVVFDVLLNPAAGAVLLLDVLHMTKLRKQNWLPQASGIAIQAELVEELELLWSDFLTSPLTGDLREG